MIPIKYTQDGNITHFVYEQGVYEKWDKQGKKQGNSGSVLVGIDYHNKFYLYHTYGTIEHPFKEKQNAIMQAEKKGITVKIIKV